MTVPTASTYPGSELFAELFGTVNHEWMHNAMDCAARRFHNAHHDVGPISESCLGELTTVASLSRSLGYVPAYR